MAIIKAGSIASTIDNNYFVEIFNIGPAELSAGQVVLANTPTTPEKTLVTPSNGPDQKYNTDFIVTGNIVDWNGRGIETALSVGDTLIITYVI